MKRTIFIAALLTVLGPDPARAQLTRTNESPAGKAITSGDYLLGCNADQQKTVTDAVGLAARLLYRRIDDLKAELKAMSGPPAAPAGTKMQTALKKHFHVPMNVGSHKAVIEHLVSVYEGMYYHLADLHHWPNLSCEDEQKQCEAGKYGYTLFVKGSSTYFCPEFFAGKNPLIRAGTVIHEMAHRQVPTSSDDFNDKGYYKHTDATPLGNTDSLKNSDSYANFAVDNPTSAKKKP